MSPPCTVGADHQRRAMSEVKYQVASQKCQLVPHLKKKRINKISEKLIIYYKVELSDRFF